MYKITKAHLFLFKGFFKLIFREKGREGEREEEKHQRERETLIGCLSHASNWGPGCNPGMCSDWESNQQPFGS